MSSRPGDEHRLGEEDGARRSVAGRPARTHQHPTNRSGEKSERAGWRDTLDRLGVRPSKALGQNFLHDAGIVRRIADVAELEPSDTVLEVGPGLGILTQELARRAGRVVAVELDRRLANHLRQSVPANVRVVEGDILDVDIESLIDEQPYIVVANLPYSVASAAIERLLEGARPPSRLVVMVQREVAERIVAAPPNMSVLAVAVQFFGQPRIAFRIGPGAFIPPPKVESAVLRLDVADVPPLDPERRSLFFQIVQAGFQQRRKKVANSLASALTLPRPVIDAALERAAIEPNRRAETLSVGDWLRLARSLESVAAS